MNNIKYNLLFVPRIWNRLYLSLIRRSVSKKVYSTQALQYPVHMSLISGGFYLQNYEKFEKELVELLKNEKPFEVVTEGSETVVLPEKFWTGIHIQRNPEITNLQSKLQNLRNLYTDDKKEFKESQLHLTIAFPAKVDEIKPIKISMNKFLIDRITVVKKVGGEFSPYKVFKHIKICS